MKRIMVAVIIVLCALGAGPRRAAAQCHESCTVIYSPDGKIVGRGCVFDADSPTSCLATARVCLTGSCGGAFITDGNGTVLAEADICHDKVTLRPVRRAGEELIDAGDVAQPPAPLRPRARLAAGAME